MKQPRYLIIGASGFIGSHLYSALGPDRAIATYNTRPIPGGIHFDPGTMRLSETVLEGAPGLSHAFLLFAMSNIDECARNPELAYKINVESPQRIIDELRGAGIVPIFASSDAVFDGTRGMWTEDDLVNPLLTYGQQKVQVERYLMHTSNSWQVLRLSKVVSTEPGVANLLDDWLKQLEQGSEIRCARDQIFSPADIDDVVPALVRLSENNYTGIFHVCGPRPISRLELLRTLECEVRKYREVSSQITPCGIRDFDFVEPRPLDASMSPRKLYSALGSGFEDMSAVCARAAARRYGRETSRRPGPGATSVYS